MNVALKRIDVAVLFVADLDRARTFYRDTLGLQMQNEDQESASFQLETTLLILLTKAAAQDLLGEEAVATQPAGAGSQLVAFVDDVDAVYTDLVAKGAEFIREPIDRPWGLRTAHFRDPDGHVWEIGQPVVRNPGEG